MARRPSRRAATKRRFARHYSYRRLGLWHRQRTRLDQHHSYYSLEPLSFLRRRTSAARLLRQYKKVRGLCRPQQSFASLFLGPRRLGARKDTLRQRTFVINLFLCRRHHTCESRETVWQNVRPRILFQARRADTRCHKQTARRANMLRARKPNKACR